MSTPAQLPAIHRVDGRLPEPPFRCASNAERAMVSEDSVVKQLPDCDDGWEHDAEPLLFESLAPMLWYKTCVISWCLKNANPIDSTRVVSTAF